MSVGKGWEDVLKRRLCERAGPSGVRVGAMAGQRGDQLHGSVVVGRPYYFACTKLICASCFSDEWSAHARRLDSTGGANQMQHSGFGEDAWRPGDIAECVHASHWVPPLGFVTLVRGALLCEAGNVSIVASRCDFSHGSMC